MKDVQIWHEEAMALVERAALEKIRGDVEFARRLFREAFALEHEAAPRCSGRLDLEPTRSVLHRSAAALAIESGEWLAAEGLIDAALSGNPPTGIAEELRELRERIGTSRAAEVVGRTNRS